jgi:hypothetical protein
LLPSEILCNAATAPPKLSSTTRIATARRKRYECICMSSRYYKSKRNLSFDYFGGIA